MKLIKAGIKYLFNVTFKHKKCGEAIKLFCEEMGIAYVKLAQILATQNYRGILSEENQKILRSVCDDVAPIPYEEIEAILKEEYKEQFDDIFSSIEKEKIGSASVSQVHKAILKSGEEVAVKVKRKDVVSSITKDIKTIKSFYNIFGRILKLNNKIGGNHALDLYLKWILEETDFEREKNNIKSYNDFAQNMNSKLKNSNHIVIPKCYEELCTNNVIVMEYISEPTIKNMEETEENKERLSKAINSYLKMSFYAVLHGEDVIFHGDPHGGNIYIDENDNIGFLDMGLVFKLSEEDKEMLINFALAAFCKDYGRIFDSLIIYGNLSNRKAKKFKQEIQEFTKNIGSKDITCYFTDMIEICLKYEILPPNFLFCMSKSFLCMNGINDQFNIINTASEVMQEQMVEYIASKSIKDLKRVIASGSKIAPSIAKNTLEFGLAGAISKESDEILKAYAEYQDLVSDYQELIKMLKANYTNDSSDNKKRRL